MSDDRAKPSNPRALRADRIAQALATHPEVQPRRQRRAAWRRLRLRTLSPMPFGEGSHSARAAAWRAIWPQAVQAGHAARIARYSALISVSRYPEGDA